ncbi:MAG: DUF4339 domain-containing protein [Fibromonadales bacterium]|nr:DUF4339 domain-containing protein [Fibromonadales bacterium]
MDQKIWYMETSEQRRGPFSINELLQKGLTGDSHVWKPGMTDWRRAREVPEMSLGFDLNKIKNEIEIDTYKFMTEENADFRLQIEQLEKSYEDLLDEKFGIKAILKDMEEKDAELCSQVDSLKKNNEESFNLKLDLTVKLKALEDENVQLRTKLKQLFTRLIPQWEEA